MKKKPNRVDPYHITPREFQRGLFLASLHSELNKIADSHAKIIVEARRYASDGMSPDEIRELLLLDGFHADDVRSGLQRLASEPEGYQEKWGFELEDAHGRLISSAELNSEASSEDEATAQAEEIIAEGSADRVVRVFRIG